MNECFMPIHELYPDWYKIEKDTQKTISKLSNIRDIGFYLKSPDEHIRRLAILRINELRLKESIEVLKEIIDEPYESSINKELAAWTIKAVSHKWGIDLFISNRLLSKFTGNEKLDDFHKFTVNSTMPSIRYEFSSDLINKELRLERNNMLQYEDINFEMPFSIKDWLKSYIRYLLPNIKNTFTSLPKLISSTFHAVFKVIARLLSGFFPFLRQKCSKLSSNSKYKSALKEKHNPYSYATQSKAGQGSSIFKKTIIGFLYIVFFPLRVVIKHKMLFLSALLACYCILTLTVPGKILTYKYTGMDLSEVQQNAYYSAKDFVSYAWSEAKTLMGLDVQSQEEVVFEDNVSPSDMLKQYKIIAKDGLNLRASPSGTSAKVIKEALKYGSIVSFEGKTQKDASGRLWYYINTPEGKSGWVNSKWLIEN